ncbi:MAG TPA: alpha-amylase family glycosyl hydrolase [Gemmataceae bacterium]|nr:alpha-amylase family glycosyl hydrolase [Gemmataceae bacterium]
MAQVRYPSLYEISTRIWLTERSRELGRGATLGDVPDAALDRIAEQGFDWVWLLGVWQTGPAGRRVSLNHAAWRRDYLASLNDFTEDDVCGSPFAVQSYTVHADFGCGDSLLQFRERLRQRGIRLMLDFVANHTALDHRWVSEWPQFYIQGEQQDLARDPHNYQLVTTTRGPRVLAHGRDPYFPAWPDTFQLNYRHPVLREAMIEELTRIADLCDGVRCDMAMLLLPSVIAATWGDRALPRDGQPPADAPFWPEAVTRVRRHHPDFLFMAEVYWDLEWALQQQGFDYTYDKGLYDRLRAEDATAIRRHFAATLDFQQKCVRFLENQDEHRAAAVFPPKVYPAAAVLTYLVPGLRFVQEGQLEGRRAKANLHLCRRPREPLYPEIEEFYKRFLPCLQRSEVRDGTWQLLECRPAWNGNRTWERYVVFTWEERNGKRLLVAVNYGPMRGQCYVKLTWPELRGKQFLLRDLMASAQYQRDGNGLAERGLYLDMPEWGYHIFEVTRPER